MTTFSELVVGESISFETIAPGILPLNFEKVRFDGITSWQVARSFADIATLHRQLYPSMDPALVKDDYKSYNYLFFQQGEVPSVLGLPWIQESTLTVDGSVNETFIFPNMTPSNKDYLVKLLRANGFVTFYQP